MTRRRKCWTVQAVITEPLYVRLRALAAAERRSLSSLARRLICEGLRSRSEPRSESRAEPCLRISSVAAPRSRKVPT